MPEMHSRQLGVMYNAWDHLLKTKKEFKNLKKQEIEGVIIKMNQVKLTFNMTWLVEILSIY